jgi:kynurenine formamidase
MCLPLCLEKMRDLSRRRFLAAGIMAAAGTTGLAQTPDAQASNSSQLEEPFRFTRVVDLTHTLTTDFPTGSGQRQLTLERLSTWPKDPWNIYRWHVHEHTGTHLDAPLHRSDHDSADRIPAANLVGPLAIVDIRRKAEADPDVELTLDDLKVWETKHGPVPVGGIVAMCSGWDALVRTAKFRNAGSDGSIHTPGFHKEAVEFLLAERDVKGIVVDTLSLDRGISGDFPVHTRWLGSNRWGLECAANLGELPAKGATVIVGGPKIAGASGGPSRVFALL